jgi:sugar phosphate isomerase/epimerase
MTGNVGTGEASGPKVGCHLIIYRTRPDEDLDGVLREVRENGYDGIERGKLLDGNAAELKRRLDEHGLVQWSLSTPWAQLDQMGEHIEYVSTLGGKFIMVSGVGDHQNEGLRAYEKAADRFNEAGRQCQASGIQFCYHNHSWEFASLSEEDPSREVPYGTPGSTLGIERLLELTDPSLVKFNFDVYWIQHGGQNPASFLEKYIDRVGYPHFKDMKYLGQEPRKQGRLDREEAVFVPLGTGEVDFTAIWQVLAPLHLPWVVYEQDRPVVSPGEDAEVSRRFLKDTLGI